MSNEQIEQVTDASFETEVLQSERPVVVDFWAGWCGPCRAVAPIFSELAGQYDEPVKAARLNVDDNPQTPTNYGIQSIPTFLLFEDGRVVDRVVGAVPRAQLERLFDPSRGQ